MQLRGKLVTSRLLREEKEEETNYVVISSLWAANPWAALRASGLGDPLVFQHSTFDIQHTIFDIRHSTLIFQHF
jgi:hypothetical protein